MKRPVSKQTRINHSDYVAPEGFDAFPEPTYRASTVLFDSVDALRSREWIGRDSYTYGLHGTPTTFTLEAQLAEIEGGRHAVLAPSGLAAITIVDFAFLKSGDDVLIPENIYNPNRELGNWLSRDFGIHVRYYDPMIGGRIAGLLRDNTRLVWAETPGSVTMEVPDIPAICKAAHEKGALVVLDNTWSAGLAFDAFGHGADVVVQAVTKYQGGASDLLMGAVITRDGELFRRICMAHMRLGMGVGADDAYLVLRSLSSLKVRFEKSGESAMTVAHWLKNRAEIHRVLHPAFPDCPGHAIFKRDFTGASGLFSVLFNELYTEEQTDRFLEALKLFRMGFSWGGTHSLAVPYRIRPDRRDWNLRQNQLIRFYIGLEDPEDLIADLEQAMETLG
ncbi:cystathionine beta-lyase [Oxalobacter paraformigenes]|uniref:Cystathionine beta-lyase n=1 Tax=Oxalobacter paraformigenes TaxID=556268 RepID=C3X4X4_9BURK|nr:cystathionine beta-lyase [Oxalobacter paraformigenes]EEO28260.1 cystathionine beta-lyase [Oxalobacter paraformigenes]